MKYLILVLYIASVTCISAQDASIELPGGKRYVFNENAIDINSSNTLIGEKVGEVLMDGLENTFLGSYAGFENKNGSRNTFLGVGAGYANENHSGSVMIGYHAGMTEKRDDVLYISNSDTTEPLIYGDFRKKALVIHDDLEVKNYLQTGGSARIDGRLNVGDGIKTDGGVDAEGVIFGATLNAQSQAPLMSLYNTTNSDGYWFTYYVDKLVIRNTSDDENALEIKDGEIYLPHYGGNTEVTNIGIDATGKIVKTDYNTNQLRFNRYEFNQEIPITNATLIRKGVQFEDGTVLTGFKALMMDNDNTGSTGVHNTAFAGLYRISRTSNTNNFEVIYRVDGQDTSTSTFSEFTTTAVSGTGRNIVDNDNYIYVIQAWYCYDCGVNEVSLTQE